MNCNENLIFHLHVYKGCNCGPVGGSIIGFTPEWDAEMQLSFSSVINVSKNCLWELFSYQGVFGELYEQVCRFLAEKCIWSVRCCERVKKATEWASEWMTEGKRWCWSLPHPLFILSGGECYIPLFMSFICLILFASPLKLSETFVIKYWWSYTG